MEELEVGDGVKVVPGDAVVELHGVDLQGILE